MLNLCNISFSCSFYFCQKRRGYYVGVSSKLSDAKPLQRQAISLGEKERAVIYDMPAYSQSLDRSEWCKEALADGLQFVVIKR